MSRPFAAASDHLEVKEGGRSALGRCLVKIELVQDRVTRAMTMYQCARLLGPAAEELTDLTATIRAIQARYEGGAMQ